MIHPPSPVTRFILIVTILVVLNSILYGIFFSAYINAALSITQFVVNQVFASITLVLLPLNENLLYGLGIEIGASQKIVLTYDLFFVGLNMIFATALVLATWGVTRSGIIRSIAAIGIMMLLHSLKILFYVLHFLLDQHNTFIPAAFPTWAAVIIQHMRDFLGSQFSYPLFPFLTWLVLSWKPLQQLFYDNRQSPQAKPLDTPS